VYVPEDAAQPHLDEGPKTAVSGVAFLVEALRYRS